MSFLELPLWVILLLAVLLVAVGYLLWRVMKCKCKLYETFEGEAEAETTDETEAVDAKTTDDETGVKADVEVKDADENVVEADMETAPESKTKAKKPETKTKTTDEKPKPATKTMADKFMDYGEMKIFDSLRENAYSLQDIKRMIREGEITEKMIEKFLARVEAMEDRNAGNDKKKNAETVLEGFGGRSYASAAFY